MFFGRLFYLTNLTTNQPDVVPTANIQEKSNAVVGVSAWINLS